MELVARQSGSLNFSIEQVVTRNDVGGKVTVNVRGHQDHAARRETLLRWLETTSAEEIAKALGVSDRHARRLRTGDISAGGIDQLVLKGAKPAESKT